MATSIIKKVAEEIRKIPFSITKTSGLNFDSTQTEFYKCGKVVNAVLVISATGATEVAAGGNLFVGQLNTQELIPATNGARLVAYIGQRPIICTINYAGVITVRNTSTTALTLTGDLFLGGTYLAS